MAAHGRTTSCARPECLARAYRSIEDRIRASYGYPKLRSSIELFFPAIFYSEYLNDFRSMLPGRTFRRERCGRRPSAFIVIAVVAVVIPICIPSR